jgi:hypothetical protein
MTRYSGLPPKWEPSDLNIYFDIPGGGAGCIRTPARNEATALAAFHKNWSQIAKEAAARYADGKADNGLVSLEMALFDSSFVGK